MNKYTDLKQILKKQVKQFWGLGNRQSKFSSIF